jgi:putative transposase
VAVLSVLLELSDVEELLLERGVTVTYEAIRKWCHKFGHQYANQLRRRRPRPGDKWHLDEVFLTIKGERHYLWRAVDQEGNVLDILVQRRRDKRAAKKFLRKLLKGLSYVPRVIVTDKLKSYAAAKRELLPGVDHRRLCRKFAFFGVFPLFSSPAVIGGGSMIDFKGHDKSHALRVYSAHA